MAYMPFSASTPHDELLRECIGGRSSAAWEEFIHRYQPVIAGAVLRLLHQRGRWDSTLTDDLVQDVFLKLCADNCRLLRNFKPVHPDAIYGYLKVIAASVTQDHFRSAHCLRRGGAGRDGKLDAEDVAAAPDAVAGPARLERDVLLAEIDTCLRTQLPDPDGERDRTIFWLYYREGLTASAIASLPGMALGVKGVESAILRVTRIVRHALAERDAAAGCADEGAGISQHRTLSMRRRR
jgi:RNA polymerase sigma-70 factor (ECF subfamily)